MDIVGKTIQNGEPTPEHPVEIENKINILLAVDDENNSEKEYRLPFLTNIEQQAIETVLSELEKKEAIINEMAKHIHLSGDYECLNKECEDDGNIDCEECIKEYFTKVVPYTAEQQEAWDKIESMKLSVADFKTWLSTHNLTVEYELAEPEKVEGK